MGYGLRKIGWGLNHETYIRIIIIVVVNYIIGVIIL